MKDSNDYDLKKSVAKIHANCQPRNNKPAFDLVHVAIQIHSDRDGSFSANLVYSLIYDRYLIEVASEWRDLSSHFDRIYKDIDCYENSNMTYQFSYNDVRKETIKQVLDQNKLIIANTSFKIEGDDCQDEFELEAILGAANLALLKYQQYLINIKR